MAYVQAYVDPALIQRFQPVMLGGAKPPFSGQGGEGRWTEARGPMGRKRGWGLGGSGSQPPPYQLESLGSAVSSLGGPWPNKDFLAFYRRQIASL